MRYTKKQIKALDRAVRQGWTAKRKQHGWTKKYTAIVSAMRPRNMGFALDKVD